MLDKRHSVFGSMIIFSTHITILDVFNYLNRALFKLALIGRGVADISFGPIEGGVACVLVSPIEGGVASVSFIFSEGGVAYVYCFL